MPRFNKLAVVTSALLFIFYYYYPSTTFEVEEAAPIQQLTPAAFIIQTEDKNDNVNVTIAQPPQASTLREKLAVQFPYNVSSVFPAFIWQTWKISSDSPEFAYHELASTWSDSHPGYIHEVVTDDIAAVLVSYLYQNIPEIIQAYESPTSGLLKADFFRYLILLARGGIYADIDTSVIKTSSQWFPSDVSDDTVGLIVGIEADLDRDDWAEWFARRVQVGQSVMKSKPGHPALLEIVAHIAEHTLYGGVKPSDLRPEIHTGAAVWTDSIFNYFSSKLGTEFTWKDLAGLAKPKVISDVLVLPITGFAPGLGYMGSRSFDDVSAMVKHYFGKY